MKADRLYEAPFTDVSPQGPDALFTNAEVEALLAVLDSVRVTATAA